MEINWMERGSSSGAGELIVTIPAGEYLQIRHGSAESPIADLEEQTPVGHAITYHIKVVASKDAV